MSFVSYYSDKADPKGMKCLKKPTYYIQASPEWPKEKYECQKEAYRVNGYRVVMFTERSQENEISEGIKALFQNYCEGK